MMPRRRCSLQHVAVIVSAMALSGLAQPVFAEDLLQLWDVAVQRDGEYQSARHRYLADQESTNQSRALLLPDLSLQYESKTTDQTINSSDNAVFNSDDDKYDTTTYGVTLTQSIFDYSRWQRYSQSKLTVNKAEVEFSLARQQLLLRLAESYFLVLERGDQLETVLTEKAAMFKSLELAERKLESGLGRRVDVEDARARYLNALSKEVELQSRLQDSRYGLREVLGSIPQRRCAPTSSFSRRFPMMPRNGSPGRRRTTWSCAR